MVVTDLIFDLILFGALLIGVVLDSAVPLVFPGVELHGAGLAVAVGAAAYIAAQELADTVARRQFWSQDSLATALALSVAGFIYYWWNNTSDFVLLLLSIGLMMASLMIAISIIAALGQMVRDRSPRPLIGWILTAVGALILGILAGLLTLEVNPIAKIGVIIAGFVIWKLREGVRPPDVNAMAQPPTTPDKSVGAMPNVLANHAGGRWMLIPRRGTLLDRLVPLLLLGAMFAAAARPPVQPSPAVATPAANPPMP